MTGPAFMVAVSEDGRHSVWPMVRVLPWGWMPEGFEGSRDACLKHIAAIWTELAPERPTS